MSMYNNRVWYLSQKVHWHLKWSAALTYVEYAFLNHMQTNEYTCQPAVYITLGLLIHSFESISNVQFITYAYEYMKNTYVDRTTHTTVDPEYLQFCY